MSTHQVLFKLCWSLGAVVLLLVGCPYGNESSNTACEDNDGDKFPNAGCGGKDCNDGDPAVFPGAKEICDDGKDNDCDGLIDAADPDCAPHCSDNTQILCNGFCVDTLRDSNNCGWCGYACPSAQFCANGVCATDCGSQTLCGQTCVDLSADGSNCGTCGRGCISPEICQGSNCVLVCGAKTNCDGTCVDTTTDTKHCGSCGHACDSNQACIDANCLLSCSALTNCAGSCVDVSNDRAHCGSCQNACRENQVCQNGGCITSCGSQTDCHGTCVDLSSDDKNCSACDAPCPTGKICQNSTCVPPCGHTDQACCPGGSCQGANDLCHSGLCRSADYMCNTSGVCIYGGVAYNTCVDQNTVLIQCLNTSSIKRCNCIGSGLGWHDYCAGECGGIGEPCCYNGSDGSHTCDAGVCSAKKICSAKNVDNLP